MEMRSLYKRHTGRLALLAVGAAVLFSGALSPHTRAQAAATPPAGLPRKPIERLDRATLQARLKGVGFKKKGGIDRMRTDSVDRRLKSLPHFSGAFNFEGKSYPWTMVGDPPSSGRTSKLRSVIIPLRMKFVFFEQDATFDPDLAVTNIAQSPIYEDAPYPNATGQFGDVLQRTTFWNKMDAQRRWHVKMAKPRIGRTIDVQVTPDIGELIQVTESGDMIGNVRFGAIDSQIHTILQLVDVQPDEVPIFVTQNVFADALGYHDAFSRAASDGSETLQTLIYTSWLDINIVGDLLADVSTLSHEVSEWLNDPFVNNIVPLWAYPPRNEVCGDNPYLEVGDPTGNGPDFAFFPNYVVSVNNYAYHLQTEVMLPWFARESPSSAQNGWYSFPDAGQITTPAVSCTTPSPPPPPPPPASLQVHH